jgi:hypothetical protein
MTQATGANQPTNSGTLLWFNQNHPDFLVATNITLATTTMDLWFVMKYVTISSGGATLGMLFGSNAGSPVGIGMNNGSDFHLKNFVSDAGIDLTGNIYTNILGDVLLNNVTATLSYTNGVSTTLANGLRSTRFDWLGKDNGNNGFIRVWNGAVGEICIYTNHQMTAGDVTTLHNYAKAVYGVTP